MVIVVPVIRRVDIRLNITAAVLSAAAACLIFSLAKSFPAFCIGMVFAGLAYGAGGLVSVSIIIQRWFDEHEGLALGICAAGTGLSAVIGAPIITAMIEKNSMSYSLRVEAAFMVLVAALVFLLLRNYPSRGKQEEIRRIRQAKMTDRGRHEIFVLTRRQKVLLLLGVLLCGMSYNVSPFMTVLFREKGFDAVSVGWMASLMGLAICIGKCAYGEAVDRLGRVCAGNLFYACFVLAIILCALCAPGNGFMAYTALALLGFGFPMVSVGLSELAAGTADKAYYADAVKMLQILYTIGSALFGVVPGVLADWLGRYTPSYYLMALMALVGAALQQGVLMSERSKRPA